MIESAGVLLQSQGLYLLGHPSGRGDTQTWGIPKGKVDERESRYEAAIREFEEETGLDLSTFSRNELVIENEHCDKFRVGQKKTVYVFRAWDVATCQPLVHYPFRCDSLIENTDRPELDAFKWATIDECITLSTPSQKEFFKRIKQS